MYNNDRESRAKVRAEYLSELFASLARRIELGDKELMEESIEDITRVLDRLGDDLNVRF